MNSHLKYFLFFTNVLLISQSSLAQSAYKNVIVDIQESIYEYPVCEPSIAIDPTNPANIVAGAILDRVYWSADTGKTWTKQQLKSPLGVYGDPCVIATKRGDFYYLHLANPTGQGYNSEEFLDFIVCQRSTDKGKTWSSGSAIGYNHPKDQDKQWAISSADGRKIYTSWTQFDKYESEDPKDSSVILFSQSKFKTKKWKKPVRVSELAGTCKDDDYTTEGAVPATGPNDEIYVAWALGEKIYFDRSFDGGKTFLPHDIKAAEIIGGWNQNIQGIMRSNGMPILLCDNSVKDKRGRLYLFWSDKRNGENNVDIWMSFSADQGITWSPAARVNNDNTDRQQFFPWPAIDQTTGNLYVVFYDRRNYTDTQTDVYLATSKDGGLSWQNERISEKPFVPNPEVFFGDYNNLSVINGIVRPIWTHYENGKMSIRTALIKK